MADIPDAPPAPPPAAIGSAPSGPGASIGDVREQFENLSRQQPRNPDAGRAFIEGKIDMIRGDPQLSDAEKEVAIADLKRLIERK